jgi:L-asparaginase
MPKSRKRVLVLYTGGTIGMVKSLDNGAYVPFDFTSISSQFPEIERLDCDVELHSFSPPLDSSNIGPEIWVKIALIVQERYGDFDGFVILHGSDTMAYTGSALSFMLEGLNKPVILTGAQLPMNEIRTDARENFMSSLQLASDPDSRVREVGIYFEYKLYRANRAKKVHADVFSAFDSPNFPALVEAGVHLNYRHPTPSDAYQGQDFRVHTQLDVAIANCRFFPGLTPEAVEPILMHPKTKGVIIQSFGAGNLPTNKNLIDLIQESIRQGKVLLNITQCNGGSVEMGRYSTSALLLQSGVVSGIDLTFEAALTKMMYLFGKLSDTEKVKYYLQRNIRGEMRAERAVLY